MKKINWLLVIGMIVGTLYYAVFQYDSDRLLTYLAVIPVLGFPLLLRKTKFKLNEKELCYYYVFVFLADFLGCVVNLYNTTWWYDVVIHFGSGIFTFMMGLFLLNKFNVGNDNFWFKVLFCFCVVMTIAGMWELFEFLADNLLGLDLQHNSSTGVMDTMIDVLAAFIGGILSMVGYYVMNKK